MDGPGPAALVDAIPRRPAGPAEQLKRAAAPQRTQLPHEYLFRACAGTLADEELALRRQRGMYGTISDTSLPGSNRNNWPFKAKLQASAYLVPI
jgi:hypothetical protein